MNLLRPLSFAVFTLFGAHALALEATPDLPPQDAVARVLLAHPDVEAATSGLRAEEANRDRLAAGHYEWNVRVGGQQRNVRPVGAAEQNYNEFNTALERPFRLPGKSSKDAEIGDAGVSLAETMRGDALHETSRALLRTWFIWLREVTAARQWRTEADLLAQQANAVRRRQQLGDAARVDSVLADAAEAQARSQLAQAELRERTAREDLVRRFPGLPLVEPAAIDPLPIGGEADEWIAEIVNQSHELGLARKEAERARLIAQRTRQDRLPDPSFGVQYARERGGEEKVLGAYISIPLPGTARFAAANAASAQADAAERRQMAIERRIGAEAAAVVQTARTGVATWQASRDAADRLTQAASMTTRAYQLGEGTLNDLLLARRQANEAQLAAALARLDAREQRYRLLLDAHKLWDLD